MEPRLHISEHQLDGKVYHVNPRKWKGPKIQRAFEGILCAALPDRDRLISIYKTAIAYVCW